MKYYAITNHSDHSLIELPFHPSKGESKGYVCPTHKTKAEHREWAAKPTTDHRFFSAVAPINPSRRCSLENPAKHIYGFVADYDAPCDPDKLKEKIEKLLGDTIPHPTWASDTWSGYLRLVWEFESGILIPEGGDKDFLKALGTRLKVGKLAAGFDKTSFEATRYYEIGTNWREMGGGTIPKDMLVGTVFTSFKPVAVSEITVPFEDVASEIMARFSDRLPNGFEVGDRVPLFWIDDGIDRIGAIVKEEGVYAFSDRADTAWNNWGAILGYDWVKQYEDRKISSSVDNVYTDGRSYWMVENEKVFDENKENFVLRLRQMGFKTERKKGQPLSELDRVLFYINSNKRVDGVGPFVFRKERVVEIDNRRVLNTSRNKPIEPAATGDRKKWPWLHKFFLNLFGDQKVTEDTDQLDLFFSWLKRFYIAAYDRRKLSGQCLILSGPTGRGKTLLSKQIVGRLVGGSEDASHYLTGQEKFNANLIRTPLWTVDDTSSASDWRQNRKMTDLIKRSVANPFVEAREMYHSPMEVEWNGRLMVSLNEDANSLSVVPQQDSSNRDKVIGLRIAESSIDKFPPNEELEALIWDELPYFAQWLLEDFDTPPELEHDARYGVLSWFHPHLRDAARDNSPTQAVMEVVDLFAKLHREHCESEVWTGTVAELMGQMGDYSQIKARGGSFEHQRLARDLKQASENCIDNPSIRPVVGMPTGGGTIWVINLSNKYDLKHDD